MEKYKIIAVICLLMASVSLAGQMDEGILEYVDAQSVGIDFQNIITETEERNIFVKGMPYIYAGGGVAAGDVNNDGLPDLFFTGNEVPSKLFLNNGNWQFEDVTEAWGIHTTAWCTGTVMADVNGDGWLDIYVLKAQNNEEDTGGNQLYINQGGKGFKEEAERYRLNLNARFLSASFFDMDNDGDLDLYLPRYPDNSGVGNDINFDFNHSFELGQGNDFLLENINNKYFKDISKESGLVNENGFGISVVTADFNNDGWTDIYVGNDFAEHDFLYLNNGDKTFTESIEEKFAHTSFFTMGLDISDLNNDLLPDLVTLDMNPEGLMKYKTDFGGFDFNIHDKTQQFYYQQEIRNTLQIQNQSGTFTDIGQVDKIAFTDWSWSALFVDMDLDGYKDIFVTNGLKKDILNQNLYMYELDSILKSKGVGWENVKTVEMMSYIPASKIKNYIFKNLGGTGFDSKGHNWIQGKASISTGAAYADLDMDGDMEIICNDIDEHPLIYKNLSKEKSNSKHIGFFLKKDGCIAYGSKVVIHTPEGTQMRELINARGIQSSSQPVLHFGLGQLEVDSAIIYWQGGQRQSIIKPAINQYHRLEIENRKKLNNKGHKINNITDLNFKKIKSFHYKKESPKYFKIQPLLLQEYSNKTPCVIAKDVNGNGFSDILIGAYSGNDAELLLQQKDGTYQTFPIPNTADRQDSQAAFADMDGDGQPELLLASSDFAYLSKDSSRQFLHIYKVTLDGGKPRFSPYPTPFNIHFPISDFVTADFDQNGEMDIAIFGQTTAHIFPETHPALLLKQKGGTFIQDSLPNAVAARATTHDHNQDGKTDIYLAGHYAPPRVLINTGSGFSIENLIEKNGFWNKIIPIPLLNDGKTDLLLLNAGQNRRFNLKQENTLVLHAQDFNDDGRIDPVICAHTEGGDYPIYTFRDFTKYFPYARKQVYDTKEYAHATLQDIFPEHTIQTGRIVDEVRSLWLAPDGEIRPLPQVAQWTRLNDAFLIRETREILLAGNSDNTRPDLGDTDGISLLSMPLYMDKKRFYFKNECTPLSNRHLFIKKIINENPAQPTSNLLISHEGIFILE